MNTSVEQNNKSLAMISPELLAKVHAYIADNGLGAAPVPLTTQLTPEAFAENYYDTQSLKRFCKERSLSTQGLKKDLEKRIDHYLRTGKILPAKPKWKPVGPADSSLGLRLDLKVNHYKSDDQTRAFFNANIPEFDGFSAYVQKWLKEQLAAGETLTYRDVINKHIAYTNERKQQKAQGMQRQVAHDSCEMNQFQIDYSRSQGIKLHSVQEAWQLIRNSAGDKTYERYEKTVAAIIARFQRSS